VRGVDQAETLFLTAQATTAAIERGAIRGTAVSDALQDARGRVVVLLDSCHSGYFSRELLVPNDALASALHKDERILVFSAAKGSQLSFEPRFARGLDLSEPLPMSGLLDSGNGLFTAALLATLDDPRADLDGDGELGSAEWIDGVTELVNRASGRQQTPWVTRREIHGDFLIGFPANRKK
jgi:hypothetical protein